jgi:hypothetical protein
VISPAEIGHWTDAVAYARAIDRDDWTSAEALSGLHADDPELQLALRLAALLGTAIRAEAELRNVAADVVWDEYRDLINGRTQ